MKFRFIQILSLLLLFTLGCSPKDKSANSSDGDPYELLEKEVLEHHDIAMAEMGKIEQLFKKLPQLQSLPSFEKWPQERKTRLETILNDLGAAKRNMWDWMYAYKKPEDNVSDEDKMKYMESEKVKVLKVEEDIMNSISAAEKFMAQYGIE